MGNDAKHTKCTAGRYDGDVRIWIDEPVCVDPCIADLVLALNLRLRTVASCCGHGHRPGRISLADGRELFVTYTRAEADELERLYPFDIHGKPVRTEGGSDHG